jgi:glycosyltransferase involved in cell wall biosynthesis
MKTVAVSFTNFGPYHLARLRALAGALSASGGRLIAYETAGAERTYPWETPRRDEPFEWVTLFPDRVLEEVPAAACARAMSRALRRDRPDALGVVGYVRPESMAMLRWGLANGRPRVLMSESQAIDHPRVWWKEAVKSRRVRRFSAGFVGGPRHRDYLVSLGMPALRISLGYNAVDSAGFAARAEAFRRDPDGRAGLPAAPYFLAVSRFAPEKNLAALVRAYARYRADAGGVGSWDLVLCGDGPAAGEVEAAVAASGCAGSIHRPGFLQAGELARWYAFASAFVHSSLMEPWGLVVNEAAACGLPLLVSDRAGCAETFVIEGSGATGRRIDPRDVDGMAGALAWVAGLPEDERRAMGGRAQDLARQWGPERFAQGAIEAFRIAEAFERLRRHGGRPTDDPACLSRDATPGGWQR